MNDTEYRAFLNLLMCSDDRESETVLTRLADDEARERGFDNWMVAYRKFQGTALEFETWWENAGEKKWPNLKEDIEDYAKRVALAAWKAAGERIETVSLQPMREIPMLPYQQRLIDEKTQLDERLGKLTAFFDTDPFPDLPQAEQDRMRRQATHMKRYSDILGERIEAWEQPGK